MLKLCLITKFSRRAFSVKGIENADIMLHHDATKTAIIRMRQSHIPLVMPAFRTFALTETTAVHFGVVPQDDTLEAMLHNFSLYPISYFTIHESGQVVSLALQDMVFRDNSKDPRPKIEVPFKKGDPIQILAKIAEYSERRIFQLKPQVNQLIHSNVAWTKPELRRYKLSGAVTGLCMKENLDTIHEHGCTGCYSVVTSIANRGNLEKIGFEMVEDMPDRMFTKADGSISIPPEGNSTIVYADFASMIQRMKADRERKMAAVA